MNKKYKIAIAGCGYVGLTTGLGFANNGHQVTCIDINNKIIDKLNHGIIPFYEKGIDDLLLKCHEFIHFATNGTSYYKDSDIIFVAVNTPENMDGSADLQYLYNAVEQIACSIEHECLIVIKSTVPVGTTDKIRKKINMMIEKNLYKSASKNHIEVAFNPEFLSQGSAVHDILYPSRIIIGADTKWAKEILYNIYEPITCEKIIMDVKSAEMTKYAANCCLALKIAYINEIADLCEISGADIRCVKEGISSDPRIGNTYLNAGVGYGGSCFPKDTKALVQYSNENHFELKTIKAAVESNNMQIMSMYNKAVKKFHSLKEMKIAILGLTFKPETDDLKSAPSLKNIEKLLQEGVYLQVYDPIGMNNFKQNYANQFINKENIFYANSIDEALKDTDMCFIFTEWDCIKKFDIQKMHELMKQPVVFDGRNIFDPHRMKVEKIDYYCIGVK